MTPRRRRSSWSLLSSPGSPPPAKSRERGGRGGVPRGREGYGGRQAGGEGRREGEKKAEGEGVRRKGGGWREVQTACSATLTSLRGALYSPRCCEFLSHCTSCLQDTCVCSVVSFSMLPCSEMLWNPAEQCSFTAFSPATFLSSPSPFHLSTSLEMRVLTRLLGRLRACMGVDVDRW